MISYTGIFNVRPLLVFLFFLPLCLSAQQITTTALGYQEFTTFVSASAGDEQGNVYYAGSFKGEMRINSQTAVSGQGGMDIFLVKANASGDVLWYRTWGDAGDQSIRNIYFHNGHIYMSHGSADTLRINNAVFPPYPNAIGVSLVSKISTSTGNIIWTHRTNIFGSTFFGTSSTLHLYGSTASAVRWDEQKLLDSIGPIRQMFLTLDTTTGNVVSFKRINLAAGNVTVQHVEALSPTRIFMALRTSGSNSLFIDNQSIPLPSSSGFLIFLKTDTSFTSVQHRIMNPTGIPFQLGFSRTNLAISPAKDSIYLVANSNSSADNIFYALDGYNQSLFRKNALAVLDTNFITSRLTMISPHISSTNAVQFKSIGVVGGNIFLFGQVAGNNQAPPLVSYPSTVVNLAFMPGLTDTFNVDGPSRSFVIKADAAMQNLQLKWLGSHTVYESNNLDLRHLSAHNGRFYFSHSADNIWNPWCMDTSLNILSGAMRQNADRADNTRNVEFLSDGSLVIAGISHGKTMLDNSYSGIGMGNSRRDFFLVKQSPSGQVSWFKRIFSSYTNANLSTFRVRNDNVYAFIRFSGNTNKLGYNYVRLDTSTLMVTSPNTSSYSVLAIIEKNGNARLLPLDDNIPAGKINAVDIYPNGDIAAISAVGNISLQLGSLQFPNASGSYVLRLDPAGAIKNAVKVYRTATLPVGSPALQFFGIRVLPEDTSLLVSGSYTMLSGQSGYVNFIHNGVSIIDSLVTINHEPTATANSQYAVVWHTDFTGSKSKTVLGPGASADGPQSTGQLGQNKYLTFSKSGNLPMRVNGQTVITDTLLTRGIMTLKANGDFQAMKTWNNGIRLSAFIPSGTKVIGSDVFISGSLERAFTFDTISVGNNGMTDALTMRYDTSLKAKQSYRLATPYYEGMYDMALFRDSLMSFAYVAQESPTFYTNRTAVNPLDKEQDAFLGMMVIKKTIEPPVIPLDRVQTLYPNPISGKSFSVFLKSGAGAAYKWRVVNLLGREMDQGNLSLSNVGLGQVQLNRVLLPGQYILHLYSDGTQPMLVMKFLVVN